jgi:hypothetical protein
VDGTELDAGEGEDDQTLDYGCTAIKRSFHPCANQLYNLNHLMEVEVFRMFRYCRMSGTVIKRNARRNRRPKQKSFLGIAGLKKLILFYEDAGRSCTFI